MPWTARELCRTELFDLAIERLEGVVDGDHIHIGIRGSGTEVEHSDTTEAIDAQLRQHGSQTVSKNRSIKPLLDHHLCTRFVHDNGTRCVQGRAKTHNGSEVGCPSTLVSLGSELLLTCPGGSVG